MICGPVFIDGEPAELEPSPATRMIRVRWDRPPPPQPRGLRGAYDEITYWSPRVIALYTAHGRIVAR